MTRWVLRNLKELYLKVWAYQIYRFLDFFSRIAFILSTINFISNGLDKNSSAPSENALSLSVLCADAVNITTDITLYLGFSFIFWQTSHPVIFGRRISSIIKLGIKVSTFCSPSSPSYATSILYASHIRFRLNSCTMFSSSSIINIFSFIFYTHQNF